MNHSNKTNRNNPPSNSNKEGLVNKLQGALAKFRNERDQLHRSKELALEKCRLVKQEEDALQKTVAALKHKSVSLETKANEIETQLGPLENSVSANTKEMQFQHAELLGARAKIKQLTEALEASKSSNQATIFKARQFHATLREQHTANTPRNILGSSNGKDGLQKHVDFMMVNATLFQKCMELLLKDYEEQLSELCTKNTHMEEQVAMYQEQDTITTLVEPTAGD